MDKSTLLKFIQTEFGIQDVDLLSLDPTQRPSLLNQIIAKCQATFPFQCISWLALNRTPPLKECLRTKEGGFCSTVNGLLKNFLDAVGFNTWLILSKWVNIHSSALQVPKESRLVHSTAEKERYRSASCRTYSKDFCRRRLGRFVLFQSAAEY